MADAQTSTPAGITLDQLIALNDEIAALVRAGVPLEQGLGHLGGDLPGRLGTFTTALADRMERGESLLEVLREESGQVPPVYRAVVEAGLKSGRLPAALESVASSARQVADLRRLVAAGFLYPLLVVFLAWGLFVLFVTAIAPRLVSILEGFGAPAVGLLRLLPRWAESAVIWGPLVPAVILILSGVWWFASGRAAMVEPRRAAALLGWLPGIGRMLRSFRRAIFAEVLALLVENEVPLSEAVLLAAEAAGDRGIYRAASRLAASLERGEMLAGSHAPSREFPPLLGWLLHSGRRNRALLPALRHASVVYRRRALRWVETTRVMLPVLLTVIVGGTVTLLFALTLFYPWCSFLYRLSRP